MARPVEYEEQAVVDAALEQFWSSGFTASSVDALVAGTALNKHSLYQNFGGKNGLFRRALERYLERYAQRYLEVFEQHQGLDALRRYFRAVLREHSERGCLLVNTAVELGGSDAGCQHLLNDYYDRVAGHFAAAIRAGQRAGTIRAELDARSSAGWLLHALQGLSVDMRLESPRRHSAESLLALLATPTQPHRNREE